MSLRYYSNAQATTLSASCTAASTSIQVVSTAGLPISYPFILILDRGTASEEVVLCTNAAGTTLNVTRGYDSTAAFSHAVGATVQHGISAIDAREANTHVNASSGAHGVAGTLVGTTDNQVLTNKTLGNTNTINGFSASKVMESDATGKLVAGTKTSPSGALVGTTDVQALTNKDLTGAGNTFPTSLATVSGAQTLTNKNLKDATNSFPDNLPVVADATAADTKVYIQYGTGAINVVSSAFGDTAVTFDTPFASIPVVLVNVAGDNSYYGTATSGSLSTTGFTARAMHRDAVSASALLTFSWIAIGRR